MAEHLAGLASILDGDAEAATAQLEGAASRLDQASMPVYASAARRAMGLIAGPSAGARVVREADETMQARGILDPARFSQVLAPVKLA